MAGTLSNGMCRCCASEGAYKDISSKYVWMGEEEVYVEMLQECFNINLANVESEDGGICEVCITQLRNAFNFKKQVQHTEEQFNKRLNDTMFKTNIVKVEISMLEEENHHSDNNDHNLSDEYSGPEFEVPVKTEVEETKGKKRTRAAATRAKKAKANESAEPSKHQKKVSSINVNRLKVIKIKPKPKISLRRQSEVDKHQKNLSIILSHSNATPIRSKSSTGYTCCFCPNEYPEASDLKTHTLQCHEASKMTYMKGHPMPKFLVKLDITSLRCTDCGMSCDALGDLMHHLTTSHNKQFNAKLKNYIVPFKFDNEVLECVECRQQFNNFKILLEHMNSHYRNYVCDICGEGFVNKRIMLTHWYRHRKGVFTCGHCDKTFDNNVKQKEHERAVHVNMNKRYKCKYCAEKFTDYNKKNDHIVKAHGAKPLILSCQACNRTFDNQRALTVHTKSYHLLEGRLKK